MAKKRLDVLLFEKGFAQSREKARALIMEGAVYIDNQKFDKPGEMVNEETEIEVRSQGLKYVSRGGLKLEKAMEVFPVDLTDNVCMDIGASTGGFTDCMLQNGAKRVYAIDVGYGQLAWSLRTDERVVNLERTNIRNLSREQMNEDADFFSVDVSFISLKLVLPVASAFLKDGGFGVALIKPQFEAGRNKVGKNGVVRDPEVHKEVIEAVNNELPSFGFSARALTFSPVKGPKGNIEYLILLEKADKEGVITKELIDKVVKESHETLN